MEPVYQRIDHVSNTRRLWGKLQSGKWDWLGINKEGDYTLGYPSRKSGVSEYFMVTIRDTEDVVLGQHVVRIYDDPRQERPWRDSHHEDEATAMAKFQQFAEEMRTSPNHRLTKVQRIEGNVVVQEWFGVAGHREEWYPEAP
jgi:hypothetical protein